jgi:type IV pilus secretin PilQ/predicted competence protein
MKSLQPRKPIFSLASGVAASLMWCMPVTAQNAVVDVPTNTQTAVPAPNTETIITENAANGTEHTNAGALQEPTSIQFRDALLIDVLRMLCEEAKINYAIAPDAESKAKQTKVHVKLTNVTWEIALKTILDLYGLGTVLENGIVKLDSINNIKRDQQEKEQLKAEMTRSEPTRVAIYQLNYTKATDLSTLVLAVMKSHSSKDNRFSVQPDDKSNRLLVEGVASAQVRVKTLIERLDRRKQMVSIETRIIEASNDVSRLLRVNWGSRFGFDAGRGLSSGLLFPNSILGSMGGAGEVAPLGAGRLNPQPGTLGFSVGTINGMFNLDAILRAYESENLANIVASPTQTVMDNDTADFSENLVTQVPLAAAVGQTTVQYATFTSTLAVKVTPQIASDSSMELGVEVTRDTPTSAANSNIQSKTSRSAKTRLAVRHGETAVIGGLYQTTKTKTQERIPFLGRLPIIGALFRSNSTTSMRTELMILITPRIVNNASGANVATASVLGSTLDSSALQPLPLSNGTLESGPSATPAASMPLAPSANGSAANPADELGGLDEESPSSQNAAASTPVINSKNSTMALNNQSKIGNASVPKNAAPLNAAPLNAAPLNGAPLNGAPLNGAPLNGAPLNATSLNATPASSPPANNVTRSNNAAKNSSGSGLDSSVNNLNTLN